MSTWEMVYWATTESCFPLNQTMQRIASRALRRVASDASAEDRQILTLIAPNALSEALARTDLPKVVRFRLMRVAGYLELNIG